MNTQEKLVALKTYFNLMTMNGGARIYRTAQELGIFRTIGPKGATSQEIADKCSLKERPVRLLLDALCSISALRREDKAYVLAPVMQFLSGNYRNLSDEYWNHLPLLLKTGVPMAKMDSAEQSEEQYKRQVTALAWMMKPAAEAAAMMLGMGKSRIALSILDVGAGSAVWSLTFAEKDKDTRVTALDWPGVLKIAAASAQSMGLEQRFTALPGNYHEVDLPEGTYDLAIVANVTHLETPDGNQALFRKLRTSLKSCGEIAIFDVLPGQEEGDLARALYALGLALRTELGQIYTCEDLENLLKRAGFEKSTFNPIRVPPYSMGMILARKEE